MVALGGGAFSYERGTPVPSFHRDLPSVLLQLCQTRSVADQQARVRGEREGGSEETVKPVGRQDCSWSAGQTGAARPMLRSTAGRRAWQ
jgi:hypothetical protein